MKTQEKKVNKVEENGVQLTDEQLENVNGGLVREVELAAVEFAAVDLAAKKAVAVAENGSAIAAK